MNMFKTTVAKTPEEYIDLIAEPRKSGIKKLHQLIKKTVPNLKPYIISGMIGYGSYHYKGKSGREGDWCIIALASQKNYISVYVCASDGKEYIAEKNKDLLSRGVDVKEFYRSPRRTLPAKAGKYKSSKVSVGKSCIRFKKIEDIDLDILQKVIKEGEKAMVHQA